MTTPKAACGTPGAIDDLRKQLDRIAARRLREPGGQASLDELRRALRRQAAVLRKQHRGRADGRPGPAAGEGPDSLRPILYRRDLPQHQPPPAPEPGPVVRLEDAVAGAEVACPGLGKAYVVSTRLPDIDGEAELAARLAEDLSSGASRVCRRLAEGCGAAAVDPADILFMDIESTGLLNSPLFLVGVMRWDTDGFSIEQFLARNYAEEPAVVALFLERWAQKKILVTFNGKTFDFPFVRARAVVNGMAFRDPPMHVDLLHASRRAWKGTVPDCRLQTLEQHVCRRLREGDIPGWEIPEAYHRYVRTENAAQIVGILRHNLLDLITMADLLLRMPGGGGG